MKSIKELPIDLYDNVWYYDRKYGFCRFWVENIYIDTDGYRVECKHLDGYEKTFYGKDYGKTWSKCQKDLDIDHINEVEMDI